MTKLDNKQNRNFTWLGSITNTVAKNVQDCVMQSRSPIRKHLMESYIQSIGWTCLAHFRSLELQIAQYEQSTITGGISDIRQKKRRILGDHYLIIAQFNRFQHYRTYIEK